MTYLQQEKFEQTTTAELKTQKVEQFNALLNNGAASETSVMYATSPLVHEVAALIAANAPDKFTAQNTRAVTGLGPVISAYMLSPDCIGAKPNGQPHYNKLSVKYTGLAAMTVEVMLNVAFDKHKQSFTTGAVRIGKAVEQTFKLHSFIESNPALGKAVIDGFLTDTKFGLNFALKTLHQFITEKLGFTTPEEWDTLTPGKDWEQNDDTKYCKLGGWLIEQVLNSELQWFKLDLVPCGANKTQTVINPGDHLLELVTNTKLALVENTFAKLPMTEQPADWGKDLPGGYHLNGYAIDMPLVLSKTGKAQGTPDDLSIATVNNAQSVAWTVNTKVTEIANQLVAAGISLGKLIVPTEDMTAGQRIDAIRKGGAQLQDLNVANEMAGQALFMPHVMDWRGRVYQQNTLLKLQSSDFGKSLLLFDQGAEITPAAIDWLGKHLANCYGNKVDKKTSVEKLGWVKAHKALITKVATKPMVAINSWLNGKDAMPDDPWQFIAACFEYHACVIAKSKKLTNLPVAADATCSGVQIISALLKDSKAAALVNLLPTNGEPADLYSACALMAPGYIDEVVASFKKDTKVKAAELKKIKALITGPGARKLAKPVVMTTPYSATPATQAEAVVEAAAGLGEKLTWLHGYILAMALRKALYEVAPSLQIMDLMVKEITSMTKDSGQVDLKWVSPSGMAVTQRKPKHDRIQVLAAGKKLSLMRVLPGNNPGGHGSGAMPNLVHSLDSALLHKTFAKCVVPFGLIHDSVLTRATDMDATLACLKSTFVEMFSNDILTDWIEQVGLGIDVTHMQGDLDITQVMDSEYFFS